MMSKHVQIEGIMDYGKWIMAGAAGFLSAIPELTWFLVLLMLVDTLFGTAVAIKQKKLSSTSAWNGATKKLGSIGIVALAALIDGYVDILGMDLVQVSTVFYIGPELLSILRNAAILEVPVPPQFTKVMRYFQEEQEKPAK